MVGYNGANYIFHNLYANHVTSVTVPRVNTILINMYVSIIVIIIRSKVHIAETVEKPNRAHGSRCCVMPRVGRLSECRRCSLYREPIWNETMRKMANREKYQSIQRKLAIRIIGGYRTSSEVLID